jgi:hypothetical protein
MRAAQSKKRSPMLTKWAILIFLMPVKSIIDKLFLTHKRLTISLIIKCLGML